MFHEFIPGVFLLAGIAVIAITGMVAITRYSATLPDGSDD